VYEPHHPAWFALGFVICMLAFAVATVQRHRQRWQIGRAPLIALCVIGMVQVLLAIAVIRFDQRQFRSELKAMVADQVDQITLSRAGAHRELTDRQEITQLIALLQTLKGVAAHHSHPVEKIDLVFNSGGRQYHYRIGRDSERPWEFWIAPIGRQAPGREGLEIGRVQSAEFGRLVERLLGGRRATDQ